MSKSKLFFNQLSKLIEQGVYNYKDLSKEIISILNSKRNELIYKLKITSSEETEILNKRIEILEKKIAGVSRKLESHKDSVELAGNLFRGVSYGSVLILIALGLAITFGLMGVINMAHGELMMIGAYVTYEMQLYFGQFLRLSFQNM